MPYGSSVTFLNVIKHYQGAQIKGYGKSGHVSCTRDMKNTYKILVGKPA
jgi:hypothetical protein